VTVATVIERPAMDRDEYAGRLEAIERLEVRSRVAGMSRRRTSCPAR
jgi:hypothetical protein